MLFTNHQKMFNDINILKSSFIDHQLLKLDEFYHDHKSV